MSELLCGAAPLAQQARDQMAALGTGPLCPRARYRDFFSCLRREGVSRFARSFKVKGGLPRILGHDKFR